MTRPPIVFVAHRVTPEETGGVYLIIADEAPLALTAAYARRLAGALADAADRSDAGSKEKG